MASRPRIQLTAEEAQYAREEARVDAAELTGDMEEVERVMKEIAEARIRRGYGNCVPSDEAIRQMVDGSYHLMHARVPRVRPDAISRSGSRSGWVSGWVSGSRSGSVSGSHYAPFMAPSSTYAPSMAPSSRYAPSMAPPSTYAPSMYQSDFHARSTSGRSRSGSTSGSVSGLTRSGSISGSISGLTRSGSRTGSVSGRSHSGSRPGSVSGRSHTGSAAGRLFGRCQSGSTAGSVSGRSDNSDDSDYTIIYEPGEGPYSGWDARYQSGPGAPIIGAWPHPPGAPKTPRDLEIERQIASGELQQFHRVPRPGEVAERMPDCMYYTGPNGPQQPPDIATMERAFDALGMSVIPGGGPSGWSFPAAPARGRREGRGDGRGGGHGDGRAAAELMSSATKETAPQGECFWPILKHSLHSDGELLDLIVTCPVCTNPMSATLNASSRVGKILHCGHMLCNECVNRICTGANGPADNPHSKRPECPFCKRGLGKHPWCGLSCPDPGRVGFPMPKSMAEMASMPRTMPEGGALPACCRVCRMKRLERETRKLMRLITNEAKTTSFFEPTVDDERQNDGEFRDYIRVPELQPLLDHMIEVFNDPTIYRKYTNLRPLEQHGEVTARAEMIDRARNST